MCECNCGIVTITGDNLKVSVAEKPADKDIVPVVGMKFKNNGTLFTVTDVSIANDIFDINNTCYSRGVPFYWFNNGIKSGHITDIAYPSSKVVPVVGMTYKVLGDKGIVATVCWVNPNGKTYKIAYPEPSGCRVSFEMQISNFTNWASSGSIYDITYPNTTTPESNILNKMSEENYKLKDTADKLAEENVNLKAEIKILCDRIIYLNTQFNTAYDAVSKIKDNWQFTVMK